MSQESSFQEDDGYGEQWYNFLVQWAVDEECGQPTLISGSVFHVTEIKCADEQEEDDPDDVEEGEELHDH